ncbi:MAG: hypothetical protein JOZ57_02340, partial [Abitibacteriaceae bacterium]|nr:hypothetical protein [Abditibacteriaceae bacterium]
DYTTVFTLTLAILLGLYVRLWPALIADFPLNDGGLFYQMAQEVQAAHYHLPVYTAYNAAHIPFAYPPLAFYLAAALSALTHINLLSILRILPALLSTLAIPAFYLFSRVVLQSRIQAILATFAFTLLPRTYGWMIMGGGLTRAPGFAFAILTLGFAYLLYTKHDWRLVLPTALLAGLTALSHAEMTWFTVYSAFFLWLFYGRSLKTLAASIAVGGGAAIITAPWWLVVVNRHGLAPFQAAAHTGSQRWFTWHPSYITGEPFWPLLGFIGLLGLIVCCLKRQFYLPTWAVAIFFVQPRSARTLAMIPLSMALGIALDQVILPALNKLWKPRTTSIGEAPLEVKAARKNSQVTAETPSWMGPLPVVFLTCLLIYAVLGAWLIDATASPLKTLLPPERVAMQWVATQTPQNSRFLILTADGLWDDRTLEWFPALAHRTSVTTIQGSEWLPGGRFYRIWDADEKLAACGAGQGNKSNSILKGLPCLNQWAQQWSMSFTHIYIRKELASSPKRDYWKTIEQALRTSPDYTVVYDGVGATIFARRGSIG